MTIDLTEKVVNGMKREAKRQKKARGITHVEALDEQARALGFHNWSTLMKNHNKQVGGAQ